MAEADPIAATPPRLPDSAARADAVGALRPRDRAAERAQLKQLAQEFEAMLMNEMLSDWRRSLTSDDDKEDPGGFSTMTDMVGSEFGRALSRSGGLGIAAVLMRAFERQNDSTSSTAVPITGQSVNDQAAAAKAAPAAVAEVGAGVPVRAGMGNRSAAGSPRAGGSQGNVARDAMAAFTAQASPVTGPVTSGFGWRPDPFSGQTRFHAGLDVKMAYGQDVSSVAAGTVSFVGEQSGYGLTVVVDHPAGLQTRYAHLSGTRVQAGDEVQSGQAIARSGNSGRSTGPHLHVELLSQGRPVDPAGLLKRTGATADWMAYRSLASTDAD